MLLVFLPERKNIWSNKASYNGIPDDKEKLPGQITVQEIPSQHISLEIVWKTLANAQKWPHFLATACVFSKWSPLTTYTPSIVMSLGFSLIEANALTTIGLFVTLPVTLFFRLAEQQDKQARPHRHGGGHKLLDFGNSA